VCFEVTFEGVVSGVPSHSYGTSLAIWANTAL